MEIHLNLLNTSMNPDSPYKQPISTNLKKSKETQNCFDEPKPKTFKPIHIFVLILTENNKLSHFKRYFF